MTKFLMIKSGSLSQCFLMKFANHPILIGLVFCFFCPLRICHPLKMKITNTATCDYASSKSEA